jgi:hypothetical protein
MSASGGHLATPIGFVKAKYHKDLASIRRDNAVRGVSFFSFRTVADFPGQRRFGAL